jgi:hypothetical protein
LKPEFFERFDLGWCEAEMCGNKIDSDGDFILLETA